MLPLRARALWLVPPHDARIESEPLPLRSADQLLIHTAWSAVSRGTETLVYNGDVPASEYERMRAPFQSGDLPGRVKHGYANVGRVIDGPDGWQDRWVFCLYPHQTDYVVDMNAVVPIPADVPPERAVLAANLETAINAVWDSGASVGDRITIIGAGVLGALVARLCATLAGADVELVDIDPGKAALASALGVRFVSPDNAGADRDLIFHASGSSAGLTQALALAGFEATVIEMSWHGAHTVAIPLGGAFHSQRLTLRSSQVGSVAPGHRPRWSHHRRLSLAVSMLRDDCFDALFAADDAPFDSLPSVMARLSTRDDRTLCQRIRYD